MELIAFVAFVVFVCPWMAAALSADSEPRPRQAAVAHQKIRRTLAELR